jgi:hypothetical protein
MNVLVFNTGSASLKFEVITSTSSRYTRWNCAVTHKTSSAISVCHCTLSSTSVWICRCKRSEAIVI